MKSPREADGDQGLLCLFPASSALHKAALDPKRNFARAVSPTRLLSASGHRILRLLQRSRWFGRGICPQAREVARTVSLVPMKTPTLVRLSALLKCAHRFLRLAGMTCLGSARTSIEPMRRRGQFSTRCLGVTICAITCSQRTPQLRREDNTPLKPLVRRSRRSTFRPQT